MVGVQDGSIPQPEAAVRRAAGGTSNGTRAMMAVLLVLIGSASLVGIVVTATNGQTDAAIIIGIFAAAFFARIGC